MARVLIGIPMWRYDSEPSSRTFNCLKALKGSSQHAVEVFYARGQQITQNSLQICNKFLGEGWDYLLYTGDDITFPPQALDRMISHGKDIVGGLCTWKSPPYWTTGAMECDDGRLKLVLITPEHVKQRAIIEVDAVGSGFMLISRKAMESVDDYFRNKLYPSIPEEYRWAAPTPYFPVTYDPKFNTNTGSDFSFCKAAKRAGCDVFIDCGVVCGHQWEYDFTIEDHWRWLETYTFNSDLPPYPGAPLDPVPPPEGKVYWGEDGGPMGVSVTSETDKERALNDVYPILKGVYAPLEELDHAGQTPAGYIVGFGVGEEGPEKYLHWGKRFSKVGIHWNMEDVLAIPHWINSTHKKTLNNGHYVHLVEDENTSEMLKEHFKNVHQVSIPTTRAYPVAPFPENYTVGLVYIDEFQDRVEEVVKSNPHIKFRFFKEKDRVPFSYENMLFVGTQPYAQELARSSVLMTLTDRPSPRRMVIAREAAIMGRHLVTNFDMPFTNRLPESPRAIEITEVLERLKGENKENPGAVKHYYEGNDMGAYRKKIADLLHVEEGENPKRMHTRAVVE